MTDEPASLLVTDMKFLDMGEFQSVGYLQEVNRRFLHPLGLAIVVRVVQPRRNALEILLNRPKKPTRTEFAGVWDARDDLEGITFDGLAEIAKKHAIDAIAASRRPIREAGLGFWIEPIKEPPLVPDKAFDISNWWLPGPVSDDEARARMTEAFNNGYLHIMAATSIPSVTNQQVKAGLAVGLTADIYHYVVWTRGSLAQIEQARYSVEDMLSNVDICWIDLEAIPPSTFSANSVRTEISILVNAAYGAGFKRVGIYTRKSWWIAHTENSSGWSHLPLWTTDWDNPPPYDAAWWEANKFGGWERPVWIQNEHDILRFGMNVDLSVRPAF